MNRSMARVAAICGVIVAVFAQCMAAQTVHVVGDGMGWDIPRGGASAYATWASGKNFVVGDILTFNFVTNAHDVVKVPKASYDSCSSDNAEQTITTGPANVTLSSAGDHYFICTIGAHCENGQKLAVTVPDSSAASPPSSAAPAPLPPTTTTATPSPTSPAVCPPETSPSPNAAGPTAYNSPSPQPPAGSSAPAILAGFLLSLMSIAANFFF